MKRFVIQHETGDKPLAKVREFWRAGDCKSFMVLIEPFPGCEDEIIKLIGGTPLYMNEEDDYVT